MIAMMAMIVMDRGIVSGKAEVSEADTRDCLTGYIDKHGFKAINQLQLCFS